jgi:hypothetical protein
VCSFFFINNLKIQAPQPSASPIFPGRFIQRLTSDGIPVGGPAPPWLGLTGAQSRELAVNLDAGEDVYDKSYLQVY